LQAELGERDAALKSWITATGNFEEALREGNPPISALAGLAAALAMQGKWESAATTAIQVVSASNRSCESLTDLALLQWAANDEQGYQESCADLLSRFDNAVADSDARKIIIACVTGDSPLSDMPKVLAMSERLASSDPGNPIHLALVGAATWRAGQIQQGTEILEKSLPRLALAKHDVQKNGRQQIVAVQVLASLVLARAYRQSDNQGAFTTQLETLRGLVAECEKAIPSFDEETPRWLLGLALDLARREAIHLGESANSPLKAVGEPAQ
jgi:hypothetical protein